MQRVCLAKRPSRPSDRVVERVSHRCGVVLLLAVVCLGTVVVIMVTVLKQSAGERRQLDSAAHRLQALWLLEAGFDRAAAQWAARPDYAGETWRISADELDGAGAAEVTIAWDPSATDISSRTARVAVEFPVGARRTVRLQQELPITRAETNP